ncbi:MAG: hypothetical protein AAF447_02375 [Myxococcota bacterium]
MAKRIGDMLVADGYATVAEVEDALAAQASTGRRLGAELVARGVVTEEEMTQTLSRQLSVPWVSLHRVELTRDLLRLLPRALCLSVRCVPVYRRAVRGKGDTLFVAMDDPTQDAALERLARAARLPVKPMVAPPSEVSEALRIYYGDVEEMEAEASGAAPQLYTLEPPAPGPGAAPGPRMVTLTLLDGTEVRLPAPGRDAAEPPAPQEQMTARDLVAALLAKSQGVDVSGVLPDAGFEVLFASLLDVLLRKGLVADWEFVEAFERAKRWHAEGGAP